MVIVLAIGCALLLVCIAGLFILDWRPERLISVAPSYAESLTEIRRIKAARKSEALTEPDYFNQLTQAVHNRMISLPEEEIQNSHAMRVPPIDNWLIWLISKIDKRVCVYEHLNPYRALKRGAGLCSTKANTLGALLEEDGYLAGNWGGQGHTTTWVFAKSKVIHLLDPDKNITLTAPVTIDEAEAIYAPLFNRTAEEEIPLLRRMIRDHYDGFLAASLTLTSRLPHQNYGPFRHLRMSPRAAEELAYVLKWAVPIGLITVYFAL